MDNPQTLLQIGGIYQLLQKYCNHGRWILNVQSSPILQHITKNILDGKPLCPFNYLYVGSSVDLPKPQLIPKTKYKSKYEYIYVVHQRMAHLYEMKYLTHKDITRWFVQHGYLDMIQSYTKVFPSIITPKFVKDYLFERACEYGHLHVVRWLAERFHHEDEQYVINYAFAVTCKNGHLHVARWLVGEFPDIDPQERENYAFRHSCKNGHLHVARWLNRRFPDINHRARENYAFRHSCKNGYLHVVRWLNRRFPNIDHRAQDDYAFRCSCRMGHLHVARWLVERFPDIGH